jgi:hypothetical protein
MDGHKYIEGVSMWDSSKKNMVPTEVIGKPGTLGNILLRLGLNRKHIKYNYSFKNASVFVIPKSEKYCLLLFGSSHPDEIESRLIIKVMLIKNDPEKQLEYEIRNIFNNHSK